MGDQPTGEQLPGRLATGNEGRALMAQALFVQVTDHWRNMKISLALIATHPGLDEESRTMSAKFCDAVRKVCWALDDALKAMGFDGPDEACECETCEVLREVQEDRRQDAEKEATTTTTTPAKPEKDDPDA